MQTQVLTALLFLLKTLSSGVLLIFIVRICLRWARADFYNPLSQFIYRATNPLVTPLSRIVPRTFLIDLPTLVALLLLSAAANYLLLGIGGETYTTGQFVLWAVTRAANLTIWLYLICILIDVVMSWVGQRGVHPAARVVSLLVQPVMAPLRRLIPPLGGIDFTPIVAILVLQTIAILIPLHPLLR